ncbi:Telomere repeat-binding protein 4 [Striga hermonthica]|uniref:Telomere repeat-binding protein 4 n=1 Tax=Striga hermonthica TaxID=68872 RepID=A0A9N7MFE4_STRHE|nr:Telomere repeat-binding protein 4 [Striga hermonthica]
MVSRKRLDYGFRGYRAPVIPRAPRSIRRRVPLKDSCEDSKLCPFELLAAVAGKLLQESESSTSSNVAGGKDKRVISGNGNEKGQLIDDKTLKSDSFEHGSCAESAFVPEVSVQDQNLLPSFKEKSQSEFNAIIEPPSEPVSSDALEKVDSGVKFEECEIKKNNTSVEGSACFGDSFNSKVESRPKMDLGDEKCQIGGLLIASDVKKLNKECVNSNIIINSDSSVQLPVYREPVADACLKKHSADVKLGVRDDDENSYRCKKLGTKVRPFKPRPRTEHRRIRKMMTSKYRKVVPKRKAYDLYNTSEGMKSYYQYRKRIYTREGCQQAPIKKRKLFDNRFSVGYDQDTSSSSISNLPEKGNRTACGTVKVHSKGKDPHVKFSIKSFKVPELYIDLPETASVGSLKRTVMEAVTAILGSGIRVGVLLQGKKIRDDSRTLQQAGISLSNDLGTLGFTLEPCFTHVSSSNAAVKQPSPVSPPTLFTDSAISNASVDPPTARVAPTSDDDDVCNKELILSSSDSPVDEVMGGVAATAPDPNNALVELSPINVGPLAVVPVSKLKRSELSQRRTRRPFSVAEVEALVGAVEKLGTGRWRDVKIGAFENAEHRTYVDLKDKWKTLVHTASIAPHQRRGEPVPQELLDRVLVAHSYWSQHQSKQHGKHPAVEPSKTEDLCGEVIGA